MSAKITFSSVANDWLKEIQPTVSKNTFSIYSGYVKNYMLPYISEDDLEQVNRDIEGYVERIEAGERAELVRKFYPVFSMILDYAVGLGYINFNYANVISPLAKDEGLSYADVGTDELAAILAQAKHDEMLVDFVLILDLGLSRGELLGLKWGDIDLENNQISINRLVVARNGVTQVSQAEKSRKLSIMGITSKLLSERWGVNTKDDDFLIPSPSDATTPFNPSAYRKKIARVTGKALGGDSITIELIGFVLSIIKDAASTEKNVEREDVLATALEKSKNHSAVELKYRKAGTGYVSQISPNCWQGRYTPTIGGKRVSKNVYAATEEECEKKLAELIENTNKDR